MEMVPSFKTSQVVLLAGYVELLQCPWTCWMHILRILTICECNPKYGLENHVSFCINLNGLLFLLFLIVHQRSNIHLVLVLLLEKCKHHCHCLAFVLRCRLLLSCKCCVFESWVLCRRLQVLAALQPLLSKVVLEKLPRLLCCGLVSQATIWSLVNISLSHILAPAAIIISSTLVKMPQSVREVQNLSRSVN